MRKKPMLLSALTCLAGGWALLAPAGAQTRYPSCEALVGTRCYTTSSASQRCTDQYGSTEWIYCPNGIWQYYT